jgi:predicted GNAT family acetyltransferase
MEVQQEDNGKKGKFFVILDGKEEAAMTYVYAGENIIIDHTEVGEVFKGQGVGYKLVEAAVDFARASNIKIKPLCPFANAVFKKKSNEYSDVLM